MAMVEPTPPPADPRDLLPVVVTMTHEEALQLVGEIAGLFEEHGLDRSEGQALEALQVALVSAMRS